MSGKTQRMTGATVVLELPDYVVGQVIEILADYIELGRQESEELCDEVARLKQELARVFAVPKEESK